MTAKGGGMYLFGGWVITDEGWCTDYLDSLQRVASGV